MAASRVVGRILLLGDSGVNKHELLHAIRGQESVPQSNGSYPWRLDNKYYTADVQFDVRHVDQCAELHLESAGYEAVVMVFDVSRQASFDSVQRWFGTAGGDEAELGVRLAVGSGTDSLLPGTDGEPADSSWLLAAREWCAEHLIEYVSTGAAQPPPAPQHEQQQEAEEAAASTASSNDGASGVQRIKEALEAHMWPGLQLKPKVRHGQAAAAANGAVQPASAEPEQPEAAEEVQEAPPAAASNVLHPEVSRRDVAGQDLHFADYLQNFDAFTALAADTGSAAGVGGEEGEVEQLERLFAQVASHREQLAQLPDAQRRQAAESMVMQLMAAMGLEEEEEEED